MAKFFDPDENGFIEMSDFKERFTKNLPTLLQQKDTVLARNNKTGGSIVPNKNVLIKQDMM